MIMDVKLELFKKNYNFKDMSCINFIYINSEEKENILNWRNDSSIRELMYNDKIFTKEEHYLFIENLKADTKNNYWLVRDKRENDIGVIYLNNIDYQNRKAYLGLYANPESQIIKKGNLLMNSLHEIAFRCGGLHTLKLELIEGNEKAYRLYKRFGYKKEGVLRDYIIKDGEYKNVVVMGYIHDEQK